MSTQRFYRRRFLNRRRHHAGAYVIADCRIDTGFPGLPSTHRSIDATLTVADCSRVTILDFCAHDRATARNALAKARLLRDILVDFTSALEAAVEEVGELRH